MDEPILYTGLIDTWPISEWTPQHVSKLLMSQTVKIRIGRKLNNDVQFEGDCLYEEATVTDLCQWLDISMCHEEHKNPLSKYPRNNNFCYLDYKYMKDLFEEDVLKQVKWEELGLGAEKYKDSTFWLGSEGAYTVCHYDTYGCNLVAQIYGRKRWVLFPPSQSDCLYPTRVPYEESSVFSEVNINRPDLHKHAKFMACQAWVVTLEPGQVLYVPRHWWHFVQCLQPAISVNVWLEEPEDHEERVREALARCIVHSVMAEEPQQYWLNPNEEVAALHVNLTLLSYALQQLKSNIPSEEQPGIAKDTAFNEDFNTTCETSMNNTDASCSQEIKRKQDSEANKSSAAPEGSSGLGTLNKRQKLDHPLRYLLDNKQGRSLEKCNYEQLMNYVKLTSSEFNYSNVTDNKNASNIIPDSTPDSIGFQDSSYSQDIHIDRIGAVDLVNCLVDSDVLNLICNKIKQKYKDRE